MYIQMMTVFIGTATNVSEHPSAEHLSGSSFTENHSHSRDSTVFLWLIFFFKNVVGNVLKKMLVYRHLILWQEIVLWMQVVNHSLTLFGTACCRFILDCDFFVCYVIKIIKIFNDSLQELNFVLQMYLCEHWSMQDVCVFLPYWTNWLIKSQVYYFLYTCFIF